MELKSVGIMTFPTYGKSYFFLFQTTNQTSWVSFRLHEIFVTTHKHEAPLGPQTSIKLFIHQSHRIHGAAIYGVPWIPSIYPSHVSIYTSTMDPMGMFIQDLFSAFQGALPHGTFPFASTSEFTGYVEGQADQERVPSAWCTTLQVLVPGGQAGWSSVDFFGV